MSTTSMEFNCESRKVGPNSRPLICQVTSRSTVDLCIRMRYYTCWVQKSRVTTPSWGVSRWFPLPLFMPSMIRCSVEPSDPLALDETSFSASEAEHALRSLHKRAAPGPDGITMQELKKISLAAQVLIMRNWWHYGVIPLELKQSKTVFIPKCPTPQGPGVFQPSLYLQLFCNFFRNWCSEVWLNLITCISANEASLTTVAHPLNVNITGTHSLRNLQTILRRQSWT